ncbi:branched-chain amino acid transport system substrate-binding protein [Microcella putealis]|uniref:Branched-chain amino acid transport system substrate-binding protein n=1 Tax=Microcella putealis TaxID=337005 RepID=A0A4Q7LPA8_9MICO|nr:ABC transporter substrate-binding protein [Microcella putealis]RZS56516.1 branched-chain amino acid transport system substrate-binding protein [Microcella putealis]TQM26998.1 branched-chain amino acid transport system substrate-binding protein [Microcella putealis]
MRRTAPARPVMTRARAVPAALVAAALVLAGCTGEPEPMPTPTASPEPSPTPFRTAAPSGDGVLVVGTLLPTAGDTAGVAAAQIAAVETAVRELNEAGGVLEQPVTVVHRDSGAEPGDQLAAAVADLVARGVDVVIGPNTGPLVEQALPLLAEAGVALVSTGATGSAERAADAAGLFARVVPGDAVQGRALAATAVAAGAETVAVVASDDPYGADMTAGVDAALADAGLEPATVITVAGTSAPAGLADAAEADAVIVATSAAVAALTGGMLSTLLDAGLAPDALFLGSAAAVDYSAGLDAGALEGARGVVVGAAVDDEFAARLALADPFLDSYPYAAEAYDAVLLAALAATVLADEGGASLIAGLPQVASEGAPCSSYGECLQFLVDEPDAGLNYEGLAGPLDMTVDGDLDIDGVVIGLYTAENRVVRGGVSSDE